MCVMRMSSCFTPIGGRSILTTFRKLRDAKSILVITGERYRALRSASSSEGSTGRKVFDRIALRPSFDHSTSLGIKYQYRQRPTGAFIRGTVLPLERSINTYCDARCGSYFPN